MRRLKFIYVSKMATAGYMALLTYSKYHIRQMQTAQVNTMKSFVLIYQDLSFLLIAVLTGLSCN